MIGELQLIRDIEPNWTPETKQTKKCLARETEYHGNQGGKNESECLIAQWNTRTSWKEHEY